MTVKNYDVALRKTTQYMTKAGLSREQVWQFWVDFTPEGNEALTTGGHGFDRAVVEVDDYFLIHTVVVDIQRFIFGDDGDAATEKEMDGWLGSGTHRRMETYVSFERDEDQDRRFHEIAGITPSDFILWKGDRIPIEGVKVISLDEEGGLSLPASLRAKGKKVYAWPKGVDYCLKQSYKYATHLATDHWDAGHSASGAFRSLVRSGLSTTAGIDNPSKETGEVIVYLWLDPGMHRGIHAGSPANRRSLLSFDYSNAVYTKYAAKYLKRTGIARPLIAVNYHHRRGKQILGMYKGQVIAGMRLKKAYSELSGLPFRYPTVKGSSPRRPHTSVYKGLWDKAGVGGQSISSMAHQHMNITKNKFDCAGLVEQTIVLILTEPGFMTEFPSLVDCFRLHDEGWAAWLDQKKASWTWAEVWA